MDKRNISNISSQNPPIDIIGCGITGMIMALSLASCGISSRILERTNSNSFPTDLRTTAFTNQTQKFLESHKIWNLFGNEIGEIKDIYVVDNKSPRILHMGHEEAGVSAIGYILRNDIIKKTLYKAICNSPLITLQKGADISPEVILKSTNLTIVCEGRSSPIKQLFETRINKDYGQSAVVLIAKHEKAHENTAVEHFMPSGPFATLPMHDQHLSSVVWTEKHHISSLYKTMPINELTTYLQEKFGDFLGKIEIDSKVQTFPITAYITKNYVRNNIVLVGDIAHSIHPLAGQGLNQGIKDIESLTKIITQRLNNGLKVDEFALREYENSRIKDNYNMFFITDNINRIFSNNIKPLAVARRIGMSLLNDMGQLKHRIISYGMGLR